MCSVLINHQHARFQTGDDIPVFKLEIVSPLFTNLHYLLLFLRYGTYNFRHYRFGLPVGHRFNCFGFFLKVAVQVFPIQCGAFICTRPKWIVIRIKVCLRRTYVLYRHAGGHLQGTFLIKIDGWNNIKLTQRFFDGCRKNRPDGLFVFEFYFSFGWVDIYIDGLRIYFQINKIIRAFIGLNHLIVSQQNCFVEIGVTHVSAIHKKILNSRLLGKFRFPDIPIDTHQIGRCFNR